MLSFSPLPFGVVSGGSVHGQDSINDVSSTVIMEVVTGTELTDTGTEINTIMIKIVVNFSILTSSRKMLIIIINYIKWFI
jgi:hypothetical protein